MRSGDPGDHMEMLQIDQRRSKRSGRSRSRLPDCLDDWHDPNCPRMQWIKTRPMPFTCMIAQFGRLGRSKLPSSFQIIAPIVPIAPIVSSIFGTIRTMKLGFHITLGRVSQSSMRKALWVILNLLHCKNKTKCW